MVESFDETYTVTIKKSKIVFKIQSLEANLFYINFDCLSLAIKSIQKQNILLSDGLKIIKEL